MKLLLSSLLLASLCALSSWSVSSAGGPVVSQSPDVSVLEGETVEITCCWTPEYEGMRVKWEKNKTEIKSKEMISKISFDGSRPNKTSNCSGLTLMNVTRGDSGRYICKVNVDVPRLIVALGNGTVLTVTAKVNATGSVSHALIISLAVVAPLLLIALACVCSLRRRQVRATRVIYEVPHIDSEEVEMDKHSTSSSRGSSQWCQVPVYESVDYFQHAETKESG